MRTAELLTDIPETYAARRAVLSRARLDALALGAIMTLAIVALAAGVQKALPLTPEADEPTFVTAAVRIAATGDLNPHWFGHPGATVIYPLALVYRLGQSLALLAANDLQAQFAADPARFYLTGRILSMVFELASLPLVYLVGRNAFGRLAALTGVWLTAVLPIAISHAQVVRTDSAGVFCTLLSLWLCLRLYRAPTLRNVGLAGVCIGLATATRYFGLALVPVLMAAVLLASGSRIDTRPRWWWITSMLLGIGCVALGFVAASPFAIIDLRVLQSSLSLEAETSHVGADGLSPPGNFLWYVTQALPADLTWPIALVVVAGLVSAAKDRRPEHVLLVGYVLAHLVLISASALHWHRWTIQVLPVLALYCGYALQRLPSRLPERATRVVLIGLASVQLCCQLLLFDLQQLQPPSRNAARMWLVDNLPAGTGIVEEWYGPPLGGTDLRSRTLFSLAERALDDYARSGQFYLSASSAVYDRFFAEPERYRAQVRFYEALFAAGELVAEFRPRVPLDALLVFVGGGECNCSLHPTRGAPVIRVYKIQS
jgi:4-amino-4-deoxy-L-arabinose transferase-like glycosyltransferase